MIFTRSLRKVTKEYASLTKHIHKVSPASASFVIPASSAAAAVKTGSAVKSKKSNKKKSSGCC